MTPLIPPSINLGDIASEFGPGREAVDGAPRRIFAKWTKRGNSSVSTPAMCGVVADTAAEYVRDDIYAALAADNIRLRAALEPALVACSIIDDAVKEGHSDMAELALHLLNATDLARAALAIQGVQT